MLWINKEKLDIASITYIQDSTTLDIWPGGNIRIPTRPRMKLLLDSPPSAYTQFNSSRKVTFRCSGSLHEITPKQGEFLNIYFDVGTDYTTLTIQDFDEIRWECPEQLLCIT